MSVTIDTILLDDRIESQIQWIDEYAWLPVGQTIHYALAGNPVVIENTRSGRPITLVAEPPWSWLSATTVSKLRDLASIANHTFILDFHSRVFTVRFLRSGVNPVDVTPINPLNTYYTGTLSFIEV